MKKLDIENQLRNSSLASFDVNKEKNAFLKRLYASGIVPPVRIDSKYLVTQNYKGHARYGVSSLLMAFSVVLSALPAFALNTPQNVFRSQVLASVIISDDGNTQDDPIFDITLNADGKVKEVVAVNEEAKTAMGTMIYDEDDNLQSVTTTMLNSATSTSYIDINATKEDPNRINVFFSGYKDDVKVVKEIVGTSVKDYLKSNYVYGQLHDVSFAATAMDKEDVEMANNYNLEYSKYIILKKIFLASKLFSQDITFDEIYNYYSTLSIEDLTCKGAEAVAILQKFDILKKIALDKKIQDKIEEYREIKDYHYAMWEADYNAFVDLYEQLEKATREEDTDLTFIDWKAIKYQGFDPSSLINLLNNYMNMDFCCPLSEANKKKSLLNSALNSDLEQLNRDYIILRDSVAAYYEEEKVLLKDIKLLLKDNQQQLQAECDENVNYWDNIRNEKEKSQVTDNRNDSFYQEFAMCEDSFFGWY